MVSPVTGQSTLSYEESDDSPTVLKTAKVGEAIFNSSWIIKWASVFGLAAGAYMSWPLVIFIAASALPITCALQTIFDDPYYEDPVKREAYRNELGELGLEGFIEKHGWQQIEQYGFFFSGQSPLITREAYAKAFFAQSREISSALLWKGLEYDLFPEVSKKKIAPILLPHINRLLESPHFWLAIEKDVFCESMNELRDCVGSTLRQKNGYELCLCWNALKRKGLISKNFPLVEWIEERAFGAIEAEMICQNKEQEAQSNLTAALAELKVLVDHDLEAVYAGLTDLKLVESAGTQSELIHAIDKESAKRNQALHKVFEDKRRAARQQKAQVCEQIEIEYREQKKSYPFYFSFNELSLEAFVSRFGFARVEEEFKLGFPTIFDWSEHFLADEKQRLDHPLLWPSIEKGFLSLQVIKQIESEILASGELLTNEHLHKALELGLFAERRELVDSLSRIVPKQEPFVLLKAFEFLARYNLWPSNWAPDRTWIDRFGPDYRGKESFLSSGGFNGAQKEFRAHILHEIFGLSDERSPLADLKKLSIDAFVESYGWECIKHTCLEEFTEHFFAEIEKPAHHPLIWALIRLEGISDVQKKSLEVKLLEEFKANLQNGLIEKAIDHSLFQERSELLRSVDQIDPKKERALLLKVWPFLKQQNLIARHLKRLSPWFDAPSGSEKSFNAQYQNYLAYRDWEEEKLAVWLERYGMELFSKLASSNRAVVARWAKENPLWSADEWNWKLFEAGYLSSEESQQWMQALLKRYPTFRARMLSKDFWRALEASLFTKQELDQIRASFHHPATFLTAKDLLDHLDGINNLGIAWEGKENLLYTWLKKHRLVPHNGILEEGFWELKKDIGWDDTNSFGCTDSDLGSQVDTEKDGPRRGLLIKPRS